ncbi:3'-5' exonuclease [Paracandidimonas soli]|jgi:DNA polymerase-3 subunit epsilon|uniref:3'-5' exonuclease n=1 Tax=Paracandidimonas soli TaxID=1917182 RepID=UPI0033405A19
MLHTLQRWLRSAETMDTPAPRGVQAPSSAIEQRLSRLAPFPAPGQQLLVEQSLLVFDLETSGLNLKRDHILSAGAIRVDGLDIMLGKTYERVFNIDTELQRDSQLFHGLTAADLRQGHDPRTALLDLLEHGQGAIWLAWQGWFDQHMLYKAARQWLGMDPAQLPKVLDLALIAPALFPEHKQRHGDLGHWLERLGLDNARRHHATADAMATAELTLVCLHRAMARGLRTWGELASLATQERQARERQEQALRHGF